MQIYGDIKPQSVKKSPKGNKKQKISQWLNWFQRLEIILDKSIRKQQVNLILFVCSPLQIESVACKETFHIAMQNGCQGFLILLTPQKIWIMPPKLKLWTMSRLSSFQGIKTLLEDISDIQTQTSLKNLKPSTYMVYSKHIIFFCSILPND